MDLKLGFVLNFSECLMKDGIERIVNQSDEHALQRSLPVARAVSRLFTWSPESDFIRWTGFHEA